MPVVSTYECDKCVATFIQSKSLITFMMGIQVNAFQSPPDWLVQFGGDVYCPACRCLLEEGQPQ